MNKNLCCLLNPEWICYGCGWRICRDHWVGDARAAHKSHRTECDCYNITYVGTPHWGQVVTGRISCKAVTSAKIGS